MAGTLPGVKCARRRRFHQSGIYLNSSSLASTRRSSFCLYPRNYEYPFPSFSSMQRGMFYQTLPDEKMEGAARQAKERLDHKLKAEKMSKNKKYNKNNIRRQNSIESVEGRRRSKAESPREVCGSKKNGSKKFSLSKWSWKASKQEDCALCLESLRIEDTLIQLPSTHRLPNMCLKPWSKILSLVKRSHYSFSTL